MKKMKLKTLLISIVVTLSLTATAAIQNGGFETGDLTAWTLTGNGAFGNSPTTNDLPAPHHANQPVEGMYYANSGYDATNGWVETNTGVLQSANFTLGSNEGVLFEIGGWSKWGGGGFEHCYVGLYLADDGTELDRVWTPNGNDAVLKNLEHGTNIDVDVYIKVVDNGTNTGYAWLSVDAFRTADTTDPNFDFENRYLNWSVAGLAWGSSPVTTNFYPWIFAGSPIHGEYYANSIVGGETQTGSLRSATFTYPQDGYVKFLIAGHSTRWPPAIYNYVVLKDASTHAEYGKVYAPDQDHVVVRAITNSSAYNQQVYIEAVDNCASNAYAWLAIDYFEIMDRHSTWTAGAGNWTNAANWAGGIANAANAAAHFTNSTAGNVTIDSNVTVSEIYAANVNHDLTGNGSLTLLTPGKIDIASSVSSPWTINAMLIASNGIAKSGEGTLTIAGANNTIIDDINVNEGELCVNCDISGMPGNIYISSGAAIGGTGIVDTITISANSTISPGINGIGTITAGTLVMSAGSLYDWEVDAGEIADLINVNDTLTLLGGANSITVNVSCINDIEANETNILFSANGIIGNANTIFMNYLGFAIGPMHPFLEGNDIKITGISSDPRSITITNSPSIVAYDKTTADISGTNFYTAGNLGWFIDSGATNWDITPVASAWSASISGLGNGDNLVSVVGTNANGRWASDSVIIHRETYAEIIPFIDVTNAPAIVPYISDTKEISGTNLNIAGQLAWVNNQHPESTNTFSQGFSTLINNLVYGDNEITVFGTNLYNHFTNETVNLHRETWIEVKPFIDITNAPAIVPHPQTTAEISGTNLNIAGQLAWVNDKNPSSTNSFPQGFAVDVNLAEGDNTIQVFGTNIYGFFTNAFVNIYRETWEEVKPFIDITNTPAIVSYVQTTAEISGTNFNIYGQLAWVNDRNPETTNLFATGFATTVTNLAEGDNLIQVFGTNIYGYFTNDFVNIYRETWEEVKPFIDITNTPAIVPYVQTTAEISGTNFNIYGQLAWINDKNPETTNLFATGFATTITNLAEGDNLIQVFGTNIYGFFTNDFVTIHRETWTEVKPFIEITNTPAIVPYVQTTAEISGTNVNIYGQLAWVNDQNPETTNLFATGFATTITNLAEGDNLIQVFGTNIYGFFTNDFVNIYRETWEETKPFIDITNTPAIVPFPQKTAEISGTNVNIYGQLAWVNTRNPDTTNLFATGFATTVTNLAEGDNTIQVFGTNIYGFFTNDFVNIYRETWEEVKPFIDITNTPAIVPYVQTTAEISGTNVNIYGQLAWVNDRNPETTNLFATGFATTVTDLAEGDNLIQVFGTNIYGFFTNDFVNIYRETWEEVKPFIDITNTPAIVPYVQTTAEISGTNVNIYGQLAWINDRNPETTNLFATGFATTLTNLAEGDNLIQVFGTNIYGFFTNDFINIYRETWDEVKPFINITNMPATVLYIHDSSEISGTNVNIYGQLGYVNNRHPETTNWTVQSGSFSTNVYDIEYGDNIITVFCTNKYGYFTNDTVTIHRETWQEIHPYIDITNTPPVVSYYETSAIVSGTNLNIAGQLIWVNDNFPALKFPFDQGFEAHVNTIERGDNFITISGTNVYGHPTNDTITVHRETWQDVHPFIDITNAPAIVPWGNPTAEISGTNLNIAGKLAWVNDSFPALTTSFDQGFSTTIIAIGYGDNEITILGTNKYGWFTNDVVTIHRETLAEVTPVIDITNNPGIVPYILNSTEISGTNFNIAGLLGWVNDRNPDSTNWFVPGFATSITNLEEGDNLVSLFGTNIYGHPASDSINIYRETWEEVKPFIDITNTPAIVPYVQTTAEISGTNFNIYGQLAWINDRNPSSTNSFPQGFAVDVNLAEGDNTIQVFGTNIYGYFTNDFVNIYRETWEEVKPFIDITNTPAIVPYVQTTAKISGTNVNIYGQLAWVNDKNPETTNLFATGFETTLTNLAEGDNLIQVFGTNIYGFFTNDFVNIYRETWEEAAPQIATNALVFPSADAELLEGEITNIVWNANYIFDDIDGTNLTITRISVYETNNPTNELAFVTNDIQNIDGQTDWLVPTILTNGADTYVMRFEVMDSSSLTNSRIFFDNPFTVVPESSLFLVFFSLLFYFSRKK